MAKPIWQQKLQEKLAANPLRFVGKTTTVKHEKCFAPSEEKGKKVALYQVTNYTCFHTCAACGVSVR